MARRLQLGTLKNRLLFLWNYRKKSCGFCSTPLLYFLEYVSSLILTLQQLPTRVALSNINSLWCHNRSCHAKQALCFSVRHFLRNLWLDFAVYHSLRKALKFDKNSSTQEICIGPKSTRFTDYSDQTFKIVIRL